MSSSVSQPQQQQQQLQQQQRGPLSHIIDAIRYDNRSLLLDVLTTDPRLVARTGRINGRIGAAGGIPSTTTQVGGEEAPNIRTDGGPSNGSVSSGNAPPLQQQLLFGSIDLRRVVLRQVVARSSSSVSVAAGVAEADASKKKRKKQNKNKTQVEEDEEILSDLNEELSEGCCVFGSNVLSPRGDGTIISPYISPSTSNASDSIAPTLSVSAVDDIDAPVTMYILRGGGFDLPSLSAAALHRRKAISRANISNSAANGSAASGGGDGNGGKFSKQKLFRFVFVPRITEVERSFLKELGISDDFADNRSSGKPSMGVTGNALNSLESLPIDLIPLDDDVMSLELTGGVAQSLSFSNDVGDSIGNPFAEGSTCIPLPPSAASMRHADVEGCESDVADIVARSILKLQLLNRGSGVISNETANDKQKELKLRGAISRVQGLGPLATAVIDRMMTLRLEEERIELQAEDDEEEAMEDAADEEGYGDESMYLSNKNEVVNHADGVEITASPRWHQHSSSMEVQENQEEYLPPSIQALMVIDRKIDLVTPMLTPLTYEGLIDDVLQIQVGGCLSVQRTLIETEDDEAPKTAPSEPSDPSILLPLNDSDPLYTQVRDRHVETFGSFLQNQAKTLKESHSQFTNRETARDLSEIHQFVKNIPVFTRNLRLLTNHIHIAECVKSATEKSSFRQRWQVERSMLENEPCYETLEDWIASGEPPYRWLRLFCLQSLTSNGIKATKYDLLRREVVQTYGYEYLFVLNDLENAGFLRKRETLWMDSMATPFSTLRKALNLIRAEVDAADPEDIAYVSSGYAPMTVRWVQAAMRGYSGLEDAMKELPGAAGGNGGGRFVDIEQRHPAESLLDAMRKPRGASLGALANSWIAPKSTANNEEKKPVLLVYFVGGVTYMEIAALRFLSKRNSFPYSIVCCTTEIVNGGTLLRSLSC